MGLSFPSLWTTRADRVRSPLTHAHAPSQVFRTYNASITLDRLLREQDEVRQRSMPTEEKKAEYDLANKEVGTFSASFSGCFLVLLNLCPSLHADRSPSCVTISGPSGRPMGIRWRSCRRFCKI